jgi:prepilin-type N-terminal cleavage/methylation domain-containing protein
VRDSSRGRAVSRGRKELARSLLDAGVTMRLSRRTHSSGYTLIELMVVVAIIGVLATIAVYSVRKYVFAAKTAEPIEMINSIRAAQESYRDETFAYLPVSSMASYFPFTGKTDLGNKKRSWESGAAAELTLWTRLGVRAGGPVQFGYACAAGRAADAVPGQAALGISTNLNYPANAPTWFIARAAGDRDADGTLATFIGSSFTDEIYAESDTE